MPVVSTIKERCRRCYTCVRQCPAKAIKVEEGQAKVVRERCIACGSCIKVCRQEAKGRTRLNLCGQGAFLEGRKGHRLPGSFFSRCLPSGETRTDHLGGKSPRIQRGHGSCLRGGAGGAGSRPLGSEKWPEAFYLFSLSGVDSLHQEIFSFPDF